MQVAFALKRCDEPLWLFLNLHKPYQQRAFVNSLEFKNVNLQFLGSTLVCLPGVVSTVRTVENSVLSTVLSVENLVDKPRLPLFVQCQLYSR